MRLLILIRLYFLSFLVFGLCFSSTKDEPYSDRTSFRCLNKESFSSLSEADDKLRSLSLSGQVGDDFSKKIVFFKNLEHLDLSDTDIADLGDICFLNL